VSRLGTAAGCLAALLGLAGCGALDAGELEQRITTDLGPEVEEKFDVSVEEATCPEDEESETGNTFACTLSTDAGDLPVRIKVVDGDEKRVEFSIPPRAALRFSSRTGREGGNP
jgi:hypothetical protein